MEPSERLERARFMGATRKRATYTQDYRVRQRFSADSYVQLRHLYTTTLAPQVFDTRINEEELRRTRKLHIFTVV